jgi:hypothetical protein
MEREIASTVEALRRNHFDARFTSTAGEARNVMLALIPVTATVGAGHSATLEQIGILAELNRRGTKVINPYGKEPAKANHENQDTAGQGNDLVRKSIGTDVYLASSNAVTMDGKVVNIDRVGNRVAGMIFGAPMVILPVGRNKIVRNVDEAIHRIKNTITPAHAAWMGRRTPCAVTGECSECDSPDRMCNITLVMEKQPLTTKISVILVSEDLGLGWDSAWDEQRISQIRDNYTKYV